MKNENIKKNSFLLVLILLAGIVSRIVGSADLFATISLALIVGIFCWDIEESFCILKKETDSKFIKNFSENKSSDFADSAFDSSGGKIITYILNMDRSKERLKFVLPQVKKLKIPYERISAVDGKQLSETIIRKIVDRKTYSGFFKMLPEKGTIGCSLSHEKAWKTFLKSSNGFALILEDDVKFDPKILSAAIKEAIKQNYCWDIIGFELNHYGYPQKISKLSEERFLVLYMADVKHAGAYLINRFAAEKLLERFYPIKMPLDHYFMRSWEFGLKFCGVEPRIAEQKFGDTQIKDEKIRKINDQRTILTNLGYNVYSAVMHTVYNFLLYLSIRRRL